MIGIYDKLETQALDWLHNNGDAETLRDEIKYVKILCDEILKEDEQDVANPEYIDMRLAIILATTEKAYGLVHPEETEAEEEA